MKQRETPISRRRFLAYALGGAGALVGTYYGIEALKNPESDADYSSLGLTFENAVRYRGLRQKYLDRLYEERFKENDEAWLSFSGFIYDEGFHRARKEGPLSPSSYGHEDVGVTVIITQDSAELRGNPTSSYFGEFAFDTRFVKTEDELKSMIDHESAHALMVHKSRVQFPMPPEGRDTHLLPDIIQRKIFETLAFEKQILAYAREKKRKVSYEFDHDKWMTYATINSELQQYAKEHQEHATIIVPILNALRVVPKKK